MVNFQKIDTSPIYNSSFPPVLGIEELCYGITKINDTILAFAKPEIKNFCEKDLPSLLLPAARKSDEIYDQNIKVLNSMTTLEEKAEEIAKLLSISLMTPLKQKIETYIHDLEKDALVQDFIKTDAFAKELWKTRNQWIKRYLCKPRELAQDELKPLVLAQLQQK